jgi:hypothetical protein
MNHAAKAAAALTVAGGLLEFAVPASAQPVSATGHGSDGYSVSVVGDGTAVHIGHTTVHAGKISFKVSSTNSFSKGEGGSSISMFQPKEGVKLSTVFDDLREEFSSNPATAAKGTRDIVRDVQLFGLGDVIPGYPEVVTENLQHGTYYLMDTAKFNGTGQPKLTRLSVTGHARDGWLHSTVPVKATSDDRFVTPSYWPHRGTYLFRNVSDTIHFMAIVPVKDGTTDKQVQAFLNSGSQGNPPFALPDNPTGGNDVVSPGGTIAVSYNLPRGTYVLLCFIADDATGMPHAVMGMHKVIQLT